MFKKMKHIKNEKGLTLIELLAVIVILAIIAAIAIPAIGNIINNSEIKAVKADAVNIISSANIYFVENPSVTKITHKSGVNTIDPVGVAELPTFTDADQSLGSFKGQEFVIEKNATGRVTITSTGTISAGGKNIKFTGAGLDTIEPKNAKENATVIF